ncbi:MAG: hypothetical protein WCJ93_09425 [Methanomicrobiales archaeon]
MHELLATIDDTTYLRIIEDARMKGIEPRDWINHAINEFLAKRQSAMKEVPRCENETCSPGAVQVHAEIYSPNADGTCHEIIEQLQRKVRDLETERDNLKVLLDQKAVPINNVPGDEAEVLYLTYEIQKNAFELDGMETELERLRLEREQLLTHPEDSQRIQQIDRKIARQQFELENFKEEVEKLMSTRDSLREDLAKKRR